jgi:hypothetical protein
MKIEQFQNDKFDMAQEKPEIFAKKYCKRCGENTPIFTKTSNLK